MCWREIRRNYAAAAAAAYDQLVALDQTDLSGRLLLFHGPPGTGKTTALRAVARSWHDWCSVDYVVDPERLLGDTGYLLEILLHSSDDKRWRMLVLEDCDELIRQDAKSGAGQGLARLLNLTDGLLGQGSEVLVCITTNEQLERLHPAIVRPGRCLACVYVDRLSRAESRAWLGDDHPIDGLGEHTLAELCAKRGDLATVTSPDPGLSVGQYL